MTLLHAAARALFDTIILETLGDSAMCFMFPSYNIVRFQIECWLDFMYGHQHLLLLLFFVVVVFFVCLFVLSQTPF